MSRRDSCAYGYNQFKCMLAICKKYVLCEKRKKVVSFSRSRREFNIATVDGVYGFIQIINIVQSLSTQTGCNYWYLPAFMARVYC